MVNYSHRDASSSYAVKHLPEKLVVLAQLWLCDRTCFWTGRRALSRLVASDHCLSVEVLRYQTRRPDSVPLERRLCRFCHSHVEDEYHALFVCSADPGLVIAWRTSTLSCRSTAGWTSTLWRPRAVIM